MYTCIHKRHFSSVYAGYRRVHGCLLDVVNKFWEKREKKGVVLRGDEICIREPLKPTPGLGFPRFFSVTSNVYSSGFVTAT